jgi:hypothetical protein
MSPIRARMTARFLGSAAAVERCWGTDGPGPARYGWWRRWHSGKMEWLGATTEEAGL